MSLESLVPSLELCQRLQSDDFPESALVWSLVGTKFCEEGMYDIIDVITRERGKQTNIQHPAPTSDEIMEKLPLGTILQQDAPGVWICIAHGGEPGIKIEKADTPATAALRLWMKIKGREVPV